MSEKVDIDLLHTNVDLYLKGELQGRRVGKTFTMKHLLAGSVMVSPPGSIFVILAHSHQYIRILYGEIYDVLMDYGVQCNRVHSRDEFLTKTGVHIRFVDPSQIIDGWARGMYITNYFIDDEEAFLRNTRYDHSLIINELNIRIK